MGADDDEKVSVIGETQDAIVDGLVRGAGEVYATRAMTKFLRENPNTSFSGVFNHFFPPTTHPFTREDLRLAVVEGLYYRRLTWDDQRRLSLSDSGRNRALTGEDE